VREAILDATLIYNQLVEGVLAIAGYQRWEQVFARLGRLPGLEAGLKLTQRDERRHIAYGRASPSAAPASPRTRG
jgi:ribonucleoside-diphosphate reductase beta chain